MERDVDKIYKIFKQLDNESFERMISLLAKYFYKENKKNVLLMNIVVIQFVIC